MTIQTVKIKKILYATDLSKNAHYAFSYAVSLGDHYGASLVLLHVLPEIPAPMDSRVIGYINASKWDKIKRQHFDEAKEALIGKRNEHAAVMEVLDQFCREAKEDSDCKGDEIVVETGNTVEQILKQAKDKNCDLIVMGTHGHGSLTDAMMGTTARRVSRRSSIPVLTVRLPEEE
jgi:nucleotide-binding universal stress UspA family protein